MADNVIIPATGSGDATPTIAADDVGGAKYQRVKISVGADGVVGDATPANPLPVNQAQVTGTAVDVNSGNKSAGTQRVVIATDQPALSTPMPVSGTVTTTPPANASTNIAQVAGATIAQGHGTAASALRVELPTDGTGTVVLAAGAATIGALTANQSINNAQVAGTAVDVNSGNKSAGTQRMVLATDQPALTNALKVDGSAVTQPVSIATNTPTEVRATTGAAPTAFTSTTSAQIFASNAARKRFTVYNNSDQNLFLMFASAAASATSYHVIVKANGGFWSDTDYSGEIRGIMAATINTGQVNCGEFT